MKIIAAALLVGSAVAFAPAAVNRGASQLSETKVCWLWKWLKQGKLFPAITNSHPRLFLSLHKIVGPWGPWKEVKPYSRILRSSWLVWWVLLALVVLLIHLHLSVKTSLLTRMQNLLFERCRFLGKIWWVHHWMVAPIGDQTQPRCNGCLCWILRSVQLPLALGHDLGRNSFPFHWSITSWTVGCPSFGFEASNCPFYWFPWVGKFFGWRLYNVLVDNTNAVPLVSNVVILIESIPSWHPVRALHLV